ncbi:MAG: ribosomal protein L13e [Candidatus Bathyarchaeia archaeon]
MARSPAPEALVRRFVASKLRFKKARGFSLGELQQAGLHTSQARSAGIRVDPRRSTVHPQNVAALKAFLSPPAPAANVPEASEPEVEKLVAKEAPSIKKTKPRRKSPVKKRKR